MALINTDLLNRFWKNGILPIKTSISDTQTKVDTLNDTVVAWRAEVDTLSTNVDVLKKSVSDGKQTVANAITGQGVNTAADATFATMAKNITTAGTNRYNAGVSNTKKGNAAVGEVIAGRTFTSANGVNLTGILANNGLYQYAGGIGSGMNDPEDPETAYIAFNKIPEGAYFSGGTNWGPEIRIRRKVVEDFVGLDAAYDRGYAAGSAAHSLVDLPVGVTIQFREGSNSEISQYFDLTPYKQLGYSTVTWNTSGGNYVVAVRENDVNGASVEDKGYHTKNGGDHTINLKDSSCPTILYIFPDTTSAYESTRTFTFKA